MLTAVDHIVLGVFDVPRAADTYRRLGFTVTEFDDVAYALFGRSHLEFRATRAAREGLQTLALRSDDLEADIARLRSVGIDVGDPIDAPIVSTRDRLPRRTARVDAFVPMRLVDDGGDLAAFLGHPSPHPNTVTVLERAYVAVESMERRLPDFERVFGVAAPEPEMGTVIMSLMSVFYVGDVGVAVAEPRGGGPTADALAANGPGLFQVLFRAEHLDVADRHMVDHGMPAPARGTRLSGESALLVDPANACGSYVAMAGVP